jgi:hypothetical protein
MDITARELRCILHFTRTIVARSWRRQSPAIFMLSLSGWLMPRYLFGYTLARGGWRQRLAILLKDFQAFADDLT